MPLYVSNKIKMNKSQKTGPCYVMGTVRCAGKGRSSPQSPKFTEVVWQRDIRETESGRWVPGPALRLKQQSGSAEVRLPAPRLGLGLGLGLVWGWGWGWVWGWVWGWFWGWFGAGCHLPHLSDMPPRTARAGLCVLCLFCRSAGFPHWSEEPVV